MPLPAQPVDGKLRLINIPKRCKAVHLLTGDQPPAAVGGQLEQPDVLKSKLLIGEFVILSQNYSQSATQKSLLAERIVKLVSTSEA